MFIVGLLCLFFIGVGIRVGLFLCCTVCGGWWCLWSGIIGVGVGVAIL